MLHWIGLKTLILRECGVIFRFWSFTLAPPVITTILYFTLFGEIIGKRIGTVGGVFNSVAPLPHRAQQLSLANPMFYLVNAFRWSFLGVSDVSFPLALAIMCASGLTLLVAALKLITRGLDIREST